MAVSTKIQHRRDTAANWTTTNPTLASGEVGFETDTLKFKIGNGSLNWASLAYQGGGSVTISSLMGYTSTATAAGTTTLTSASTYYQQFTGTSTQTVQLPVTSTLVLGHTFHIVNNSTGIVTINSSGSNLVMTVPPNTTSMVTCIDTTVATAAGWEFGLTDFSTYTGTGSVVMNNTPTFTTPVLGVATGTSLNVTGQVISTNAGAPLAVSNATTVANLTSTYAIRGAIVGNTAPTVANTSNMARIYVSNTTPVDTLVAGDIWISF